MQVRGLAYYVQVAWAGIRQTLKVGEKKNRPLPKQLKPRQRWQQLKENSSVMLCWATAAWAEAASAAWAEVVPLPSLTQLDWQLWKRIKQQSFWGR